MGDRGRRLGGRHRAGRAADGSSAGAMNAVALAWGLIEGGRDGARKRLEEVRALRDEVKALAKKPS